MNTKHTGIFGEFEHYGYRVEPSPRANDERSLYRQWRLVSPTGRVLLRADSRDDMEVKLYRRLARGIPTHLDR